MVGMQAAVSGAGKARSQDYRVMRIFSQPPVPGGSCPSAWGLRADNAALEIQKNQVKDGRRVRGNRSAE